MKKSICGRSALLLLLAGAISTDSMAADAERIEVDITILNTTPFSLEVLTHSTVTPYWKRGKTVDFDLKGNYIAPGASIHAGHGYSQYSEEARNSCHFQDNEETVRSCQPQDNEIEGSFVFQIQNTQERFRAAYHFGSSRDDDDKAWFQVLGQDVMDLLTGSKDEPWFRAFGEDGQPYPLVSLDMVNTIEIQEDPLHGHTHKHACTVVISMEPQTVECIEKGDCPARKGKRSLPVASPRKTTVL
ncbi:MAG: hypothetical protein OXC07_07340 [Kistimonas sp.]|nr:hypothetical protein [Kistimonas sp.]